MKILNFNKIFGCYILFVVFMFLILEEILKNSEGYMSIESFCGRGKTEVIKKQDTQNVLGTPRVKHLYNIDAYEEHVMELKQRAAKFSSR